MNNKTLLIIMLLALGAPWAAWGQQTLTVYENEAYYNCATIPVQSNRVDYGDLKCEYVIPAADIALMNETSIYAMDLYMYSPSYNGDWGNARFQVFMKEVEETEFDANQPSFYGTENATIVYTGSLDPTGNVMTIPFSSPYTYHGGNLLVGFYITQTGTPRNASFLAKSTNSYWGPTTYPAYQGCNGSYTRQSYLPKTTFAYSSEPVSFLRPRNLAVTGMTSHSVTMSWTNGSDETAWQLVYSDNAQFNPDDADPIAVSSNPYTLDGLDIGTTYYIYLRADYGDGNYSAWSDMIYVEPLCFVPSNLHADNVTNSSASLSWTAGNDETAWQLVYSSNPAFDPDEAEKIDLTQRNYSIQDLTAETTYYAYVRANCGDNHYSGWSQVCSFTPSNAIDLLAVDGTSTNNYVPMYLSKVDFLPVRSQFIIPAENLQAMQYGRVKKLTFYHYAPNSYYEAWGGANFKVYLMETDNTVFENTAMVDWSQMTEVYDGLVNISGGKMEIVLPTAFDYENGNLLVGFNQTATGASAGGSWYGQTRATNTAVYGYSNSNTLVKFLPKTTISYFEGTAPTCPKPRNLAASNVTGYSATLSWTPGGDETAWQYVISTDPDFNPDNHNPLTVQSNPFTLSGLTPETTYYAYVRANCGEGDVSAWSNKCSFMPSNAAEITVNEGTDANYYIPFYYTGNANLVKSQFIISEAELTALTEGNADATITKLVFYSSADYPSATWTNARFKVYLSPSTMTEFPNTTPVDWASLESAVVYEGALSLDNNRMEVVLTTPYTYQGGNLLVAFNETQMGEEQNFLSWLGITTTNYPSLSYTTYYNRRQFLPKMTISYLAGMPQTCFAPVNISVNAMSHSATFSWIPGGDETAWQLVYSTNPDFDPDEVSPVSLTENPFSLGELESNTTYYAYLRSDCGEGETSPWSDIITFTTDCGYMALPYSHDFDSDATGTAAPTCWHFSSGGYRRIYESASMAHSGSNFLLMQKPSTESACYAVLPAVNTTEHPINTLKLTLYARMWNSSSYYNYLSIGVMTDPDDIDTYQLITSVDVRNAYSLHEIYFDDYAGEGQYIVLRCYNTSNYFCIDDIEVSVAPTCRQPLELSGNYTDVHEANIRWKTRDLHQCNYQVSYGTTEGFNPEEGTIVDAEFETDLVNAGTPYRYYDLTNLDANTTYYYKVRANCGEGDFSAWSEDYGQFTTMEACPVPYVNPNTVGSHSVTFRVMDYEYGTLELRYKKASDEWSAWSQVEYTGMEDMSHFFVLDNLEENTDYQIEIRANCGEDGYSTDVLPLSFTTATGCGSTPRTWMCTTHLGTKATVEWFPENDATRWQIRYRIKGQEYAAENMVLTDEITSTPYRWTLTNLQTSTVYYWQVRSYCDENTQSDWSEEAWFTTRCTDGFITVDKAHPFFEDFEGADMPECWDPVNHYDYSSSHLDDWSHITGTNYSWETYNASKCISSDRNHFHFNSSGAAVLAPALHIDENATSATLSFWSKCDFESSDARGTMHIFVSDNINADDGYDFDLGTLWESFGRKSFWRKYVISLDDYIGKTINIRFEYGVTHNYNNFDWLIDDVKVEVFDNVFGEGSDITEGSWDDPSMWRTGNSKAGGGLPTINDNVLINAKVMIPEGFVAQVNKIELNIDTVQVDRSGIDKYGSLVIADGGQLKVNNPVGATMQKAIAGYGRSGSNWCLIAPPVQEALKPASDSVSGILYGSYDLYSFDGSQQGEEWRNYKQHEQTFKLKNGLGYLVANSVNTSASFTGTVLPSNRAKEVGLAFAETTFGAWNLVGNPYTCQAYLSGDRPFYRLEETTDGSKIVLATDNAIAPMEGIFVQASDGDDAVTFTTTAPTANANALNFSLRKVEQGRGSISTPIDRARIRFGEGDNLGKLTLMASPDRLYIPQNGTDYAVVFSQPVGELPLNFEASENGTYTIAIDIEDLNLSYLHLIDNLTGVDVDLLTPAGFPLYKGGQGDSNVPRQAEYTFTAKTTDYASRFRVVFAAAGAGGDACEPSFAFENNGNWIILNEGRATLQVVDLMGRVLSSEQIEGSVQTSIHQPAGLYLIRLVNGDDVKVQKVVVR